MLTPMASMPSAFLLSRLAQSMIFFSVCAALGSVLNLSLPSARPARSPTTMIDGDEICLAHARRKCDVARKGGATAHVLAGVTTVHVNVCALIRALKVEIKFAPAQA
jgi:hypothetical protein